MATDSRSLPSYFNTDADFRSWGSGLAAQFTAMGLVQTSDTGQVNWTTVAKPAATNTAQGYEIWRFADALQSTRPVYMKIEYGSGGANDRPSLWLTIGSSTTGAGTISGTASGRHQAQSQASTSAGATATSYCSGATDRLALVCNHIANGWCVLIVERVKTAAGVANGDATARIVHGTALSYQLVPYTGTASTANGTTPALAGSSDLFNFTSWGSNVGLMPFQYMLGGFHWGNSLLYKAADFTTGVSISASHLGATRTFMPLGTNAGPYMSSTAVLALIWE